MTTHIQQQLAAAYANLPYQWLSLSEQEVDEMGGRMDGRGYAFRPPLPTFPAKDIQEELSRLEKPKYRGRPHEV